MPSSYSCAVYHGKYLGLNFGQCSIRVWISWTRENQRKWVDLSSDHPCSPQKAPEAGNHVGIVFKTQLSLPCHATLALFLFPSLADLWATRKKLQCLLGQVEQSVWIWDRSDLTSSHHSTEGPSATQVPTQQ